MTRFTLAERAWLQAALFLLALVPVTLVAGALDDRLLNDISVWVKPMKFHVSTAIHLLTLGILVRFLPDRTRGAAWLSGLALVSAGAAILEILVITVQAARGVASHFNNDTMIDSVIYGLMGIGVMLVILPTPIIGGRFLAAKTTDRLGGGLKLGTGLGLILGFILTLVIAGYMSMQPTGHWVDAPRTDLGGVPIVGWSRQGGDLRVPHFFATHLMQALPLVGYFADKLAGKRARVIVWIAAIAGSVIAIATFMQALAGQPFIGEGFILF
ncbi:hypothetical protein FF098_014370 [Parvularcula flava]|uniref:Uncharacterized protein n=1 Tax=Aquisalinus luteolus TaxID=1566827 RepID=A0A8J3ES88_9PROT|nr:hypothetical protein [Aquisalinus luteolus]NHK29104.1 hypothetical protein [Aquisalinus luteolus]GGI00292.1 hypothetical protein GCM10011355_28240 [Aquisalinus luteolus]